MPTSRASGRTATAGYRSKPSGSSSTRTDKSGESSQSSRATRSVSAPKSMSTAPGPGVSSGPCATNSSTGRSRPPSSSRTRVSSSGRKSGIASAVLPDMDKRTLGPSDLEITPVGVGTAPIGSVPGHWWVNWGTQNEHCSLAAIDAAIAGGVNWIDTAPFYGWGRAEEVVGKALHWHDEEVLVFTKCGTFRRDDGEDYMDLRPEWIRRELEQSLRRLRRDHVDLLQPHDVDRNTPIEETWGAIQGLIAEGKLPHGALSNHPPELVERALAVGPVASLQFEYSALSRREEERLLPFALEHGLGVIVWAPLGSGFLTDGFDLDALDPDDFRRSHPFAQLELSGVRAELGPSVTEGALRFVLAHPAVSGAIVGVRNELEARQIVRSAG